MKKKIFLSILLLTFLFYPFSHDLNSELTQEEKDQETLQHEVTVVLKLIRVYVTDKNGNPFMDLKKFDFTLHDNGKLQEITDFEKHILPPKPKRKVKEKVVETQPAEPRRIPAQMNRKFFLIIDMAQNDAMGILKAKKAALHFIDTQFIPSDEIGVLSYSQYRGLILNEYLTTDYQKAREAVNRIKGVPGRKLGGYFLRRGIDSSGTESIQETENKTMMSRQFILEMRDFAKSIRQIPGNKNIIFFSGGISWEIMYPKDEIFNEAIEDMSKEFASSGSAVFTVNSEGMRALFEEWEKRGEDSLRLLSKISGGKYFENVDYYETIAEEIQNTTGNYYVLGYYIDEKWDGKYHEIKVKVSRKGCQVMAQQGFFNPRPFTELSEFEKRLHLIDLAFGENPYFQVPLDFPLITLHCSNRNESNAVLLAEVPVEQLKDVVSSKTETIWLIIDNENNIIDSGRSEVNFSAITRKKIYNYMVASLLPGTYECKSVLRNLKTGKGAVGSATIDIPEEQKARLRIFPPLLLIPGEKAHFLKLSKSGKKEKGSPSLPDIYPFAPSGFVPLVGEMGPGISKLLAEVRFSVVDIQEPEVEISAELIKYPSEQMIPLSYTILDAKEHKGVDVLLMEFPLPELSPGDYTLKLSAEEVTTHSKSYSSQTFKVK